jgi:hypothetical protein
MGVGWFTHWRAMTAEHNAFRAQYGQDFQEWMQFVRTQGATNNRLIKENSALKEADTIGPESSN